METLNLGIDGLDDIEQIGAGGASRVYRAVQVELDRPVALKVLKAADDPDVTRRFDRERRAMGRLSLNEGIVPVYSSGITDRGEPYLIMPYYPNGSLQDRLEQSPVPWPEAVDYVASAAETMSAAHAAGVVHLDLKPANILLSSSGQPRIADFGIAKLVSEQTLQSNTGPSFTPTFSAPENLLGGTASAASDVYGLAATLWALIAGRPPFRSIDGEDNTLMAVVGRVIHQPPEDLRHLAPDPICSVIEMAMAKDPSDRYPTAGDFGRALATARERSREIVVPPVVPPPPIGGDGAVAGGAGPAGIATSGAGQATVPTPSVPEKISAGNTPGPPPTKAGPGEMASSLRFDAPVPPRLVPAATSRSAGLADAIDRYSGVAAGLTAAALVVAAVVLGQRLLAADDEAVSSETAQQVEADQTSSTESGASAGAGNDETSATSSSTTTETTTTTSSPETTAPSGTSATTAATTTTTEASTSSSASSSTSESTTSTTEATTTTTSTSTSSSSSSSSSSTSTTVAALQAPQAVDAAFTPGAGVIVTWQGGPQQGLAGYTIFRDGDRIGSTGAGRSAFVDVDIEAGQTYAYQVRADGPASGSPANSPLSAPATVTTPGQGDDR